LLWPCRLTLGEILVVRYQEGRGFPGAEHLHLLPVRAVSKINSTGKLTDTERTEFITGVDPLSSNFVSDGVLVKPKYSRELKLASASCYTFVGASVKYPVLILIDKEFDADIARCEKFETRKKGHFH
jgi:hypothetical protein